MTLAALAASQGNGRAGKRSEWVLEDPGLGKIRSLEEAGRWTIWALEELGVVVGWEPGWRSCRNASSNTRCRSPLASFNTMLSINSLVVSSTLARKQPKFRAPPGPLSLKLALQRTVPRIRLRDTETVPCRVGCEPVARSATHHLIIPDESDGERSTGPKRRLSRNNYGRAHVWDRLIAHHHHHVSSSS